MTIKTTNWQADKETLVLLRTEVFIQEQQVPVAEEWDEEDKHAVHFIAYDNSGQAVGTARLLHTGQIGRMAVSKEYRGQGFGNKLLLAGIQHAEEIMQLDTVFLHAQTHALKFYQQAGFVVDSDEFLDAGIPHKTMRKLLSINFTPSQNETLTIKKEKPLPTLKKSRLASSEITDLPLILGQTKQSIMLKNDAEFQTMAIELAQQAKYNIYLISTDLEPILYEHPEFIEAISNLATANMRSHIHILVEDISLIIKRGHRLIDIMRKLTSKIKIRVTHPDYPLPENRFLIIDQCGFLFRPDVDKYQGFANFNHPQAVKIHHDIYTRLWDHSQTSQELRSLNL